MLRRFPSLIFLPAFLARFDAQFGCCTAVLEAKRLIARFNNMAMMRESIKQRFRQLGVPKDRAPLREGEINRNDARSIFSRRQQ